MSKQSGVVNIYGTITDVMKKEGNFTITSAMNGFWIRCKGWEAITVTLPAGLGEGFTCVLFNDSAFPLTLSAPASIDLRSVGDHKAIAEQYGQMGIFQFSAN